MFSCWIVCKVVVELEVLVLSSHSVDRSQRSHTHVMHMSCSSTIRFNMKSVFVIHVGNPRPQTASTWGSLGIVSIRARMPSMKAWGIFRSEAFTPLRRSQGVQCWWMEGWWVYVGNLVVGNSLRFIIKHWLYGRIWPNYSSVNWVANRNTSAKNGLSKIRHGEEMLLVSSCDI